MTRAARLRDAQPLREAMAANPKAHLGLIFSERIFDQVIRQGERGLDPAQFTEAWVEVKDFAEHGWISLPQTSRLHGYKADRVQPEAPSPYRPKWAQEPTVITNNGTVNARYAVLGIVNRSDGD